MKTKFGTMLAIILVLFSALVIVAGCRQADVEQVASMDETERKNDPTTTGAVQDEGTASEKQGVVARAGDGKAVAKSGKAEASAGNGEVVAKSGEAEANAGSDEARAGNAVAGDGEVGGSGNESLPGKVVLRVEGNPGTEFSGTCVAGGAEQEVAGRVPGRFVYELDGQELECEVRKVGSAAGELEISLDGGGLHRKTTIRGQGDEVSFALTEQGTAFSTFSSSGSNSAVSQETKITSSSSSSVSSSSNSR